MWWNCVVVVRITSWGRRSVGQWVVPSNWCRGDRTHGSILNLIAADDAKESLMPKSL